MSELAWLREKEELQCALKGDVRSIQSIVTKLAKPGFNLAYKTLLNIEDAEDCVQESWQTLGCRRKAREQDGFHRPQAARGPVYQRPGAMPGRG